MARHHDKSGNSGRGVGRVIGQGAWVLLPILSYSFLAWVPAVQAWWRARTLGWLITALLLVLACAGVITGLALDADGAGFGGLIILSGLGGTVAAAQGRHIVFGGREAVQHRTEADRREIEADPAVRAVLENRERRRRAREIAGEDPAMALELGIGRPDVAGTYDDGGLVDVNNVSVDGIVAALGWDRTMAEAFVLGRDLRRGYASLTEIEALSGLDPSLLEHDAERIVVLPHRPR